MAEHDALWTAEAARDAVGGALDGPTGWVASGVSIDSRDCRPGDLFVAIEAARDGHAFVAAAFEAGAAAALVRRRPADVAEDQPLLRVEGDTLRALERLAAAARSRAVGLVSVGVTGSVGKTSTKSMLAAMLAPSGPTHAAVRSFNNHLGVPLTLARTPSGSAFGVFEIGMNAPGEIAPLARLARLDAALVTTVAEAHLEAFGRIEAIADEKASIYEGLAPGGVAAMKRDNPHFDRVASVARARGADFWDFGAGAASAALSEIAQDAVGVRGVVDLRGRRVAVRLAARGAHVLENAAGALAVVAGLGADVDAAVEALARWRPQDGRGVRERIALPGGRGAALLVDESYNANPASLRAALSAFATDPIEGRRHLFVTDMLELGAAGPDLHRAIASAPEASAVDVVHTAGPLAAEIHAASPPERRGLRCDDAEALAEAAPGVLKAGDAALVKGSLGSRARLIAAALRSAGAGR